MNVIVQETRYTVEVAAPTVVEISEQPIYIVPEADGLLVVQEPRTDLVQVGAGSLVVQTQPLHNVIEIGVPGPQGPPGTIKAGLEAQRPVSGDYEGDMYVATDTDRLYLWFA